MYLSISTSLYCVLVGMYKLNTKKDSPPSDQGGRRKAVLAILREKDPKISEVLLIASHVALYELQLTPVKTHAWHKTDVEGSLFVVERQSGSSGNLRIIIRNNQASDQGDFEQDIDGKVDLEVKDNTVFYKVGNSPANTVRGLWFHQTDQLDKFTEILKHFQPTPPPPPARQDAGKALLAALGVGPTAGASASAPVAPVAAPTKIAAPPGLVPRAHVPQMPPKVPVAPSVEEDSAEDAASLLREALGRSSSKAPVLGGDRILVSKADLRMALGELVLGDNFVNELFARLANRQ